MLIEGIKSLARLEAFHAAYLRRIVARPDFPPELVDFVKKALRRFCKAGKFCLRVKQADVPSIVNDDRIKQMVELGHGTTIGGPEIRKEAVCSLFDLDEKTLSPSDYPKYGYLGPESVRADFFGLPDMAYHYGTVRFTLKRETMLERTTMLIGNGVNFGNCYFRVPCMMADPDITCLGELIHHGERLAAVGLHRSERSDPSLPAKAFAVACAKGKLDMNNFWRMEDVFEGMPGFEFFELHFHGEVLVSRDVERVDFWDWDDQSKEVFESVKPRFEALGVPVQYMNGGI